MVAPATFTITGYHGTNGKNATSILTEGLKPSTQGRLGPGVYIATDVAAAREIARHRGMAFVLTCTINVRKCYDVDTHGWKATWAAEGYTCARATHPPWAGFAAGFEEYCVVNACDVKIKAVEGAVEVPTPTPTPSLSFRFVNVGTRGFLDSHGQGVWLWGNGVDIGSFPDNITWQLRSVPGEPEHYYVVNQGYDKYLDSHGCSVSLWGHASSGDVGTHPRNIQWRFVPVGGHMPDTFYIVHKATGFYLDGSTRYRDARGVVHVRLWDSGGRGVGSHPWFIQWERKAC
jgi:hypothetical protein